MNDYISVKRKNRCIRYTTDLFKWDITKWILPMLILLGHYFFGKTQQGIMYEQLKKKIEFNFPLWKKKIFILMRIC